MTKVRINWLKLMWSLCVYSVRCVRHEFKKRQVTRDFLRQYEQAEVMRRQFLRGEL